MNNRFAAFALGFAVVLISFQRFASAIEVSPVNVPHFETVERGKIYRGGQPNAAGIRELAAQGIKTIVDLRAEWPSQREHEKILAQKLGLFFVSVPMSPFAKPNAQAIKYLETKILPNPNLQPVFVHCLYGKDRTGLVIGLYRVLVQKPPTTPAQAYGEMLRLGFNQNLKNLAEFFYLNTGYHP